MKNLKPFDLQAALSGKAVMLRDGRKAYVRHYEAELDTPADIRLLGYRDDGDIVTSWCADGRYVQSVSGFESPHDIIGMWPESAPEPNRAQQGGIMSKLQTRTTRIHLTPDTIFNERALSIEIDDEGGGEFLVIRSACCEHAALSVGVDEWPALRDAVDLMVKT